MLFLQLFRLQTIKELTFELKKEIQFLELQGH